MTDDTVQYRSQIKPTAESITFRQPEDEDGVFEVRMPIATTGEVRNEGDDPLTRSELDGMARQIEERTVGVFLDHGNTDLGGRQKYSAVEKVGEWQGAEIQAREADDQDELMATARLMDPETLPSGVNELRANLGAIKEQVKREMSLSASIGWRDDEDYPGDVDLIEASIVGIGADPRTTSESEGVALARAVASASDTFHLLDFVKALREAGMRPLGPPGDEDRFETFDECVAALMDDGMTQAEAERVSGSWEASDADTETMTDNDTPEDPGHEQASDESEDDDEETEETDTMAAEEYRQQMLDLQEQQMELLETLATDEDDGGEDDEDADEDDMKDAAENPESEQDGDTSDSDDRDMSATIDRLESELAEARQAIADAGSDAVETPDTDAEQDADAASDDEQTTDETNPRTLLK